MAAAAAQDRTWRESGRRPPDGGRGPNEGDPDDSDHREDTIKQDVADLHKLGYAQELYRSMGGFSNFAISFSIISS